MAYSDGSVIIDIRLDQTDFNNKLKNLAKTATKALAAVTTTIAGVGLAAFNAGKEFESAFAGVRKTVNATEAEFAQFKDEILAMSRTIPLAAKEIASITEAAGQLGIKNESLMKFTRTMADLGVATNLGATGAATQLARFANITQMSQESFDRLGSTIVALGNNMATTESEIVDMALNIAGAGKQVGMTEAQIMALSASLSSVGIEAAAGGTAMSTLLIEMKKATVTGGADLQKFADAANMTAVDFKKAFEEDAGNALATFIVGLSTASERGIDAIELLDNAGLTDVRMTRALLNAANASEVFTEAFDIANTAWKENTALVNEAAQRYETTESKMQLLNNTLTEAGIIAFEKFKEPFKAALDTGIESISTLTENLKNGQLGASVDELAKGFSSMLSTIIDLATDALPVMIDGFSWILKNHKTITTGVLALVGALTAGKVVTTWNNAKRALDAFYLAQKAGTAASLSGLTLQQTAVGLLTGKIKLATIAQAAFRAIMSPVGIAVIVGAIAGLTLGWVAYISKQDSATNRAKELNKELKKQNEELESLKETMANNALAELAQIDISQRYYDVLMNNIDAEGRITGSKEDVMFAIDRLNESLGTSITMRDNETVMIDEQIDKIAQLIDAKRAEAIINANAELYNQYLMEGNTLIADMVELNKQIGIKQEVIDKIAELQKNLDGSAESAEEYRKKADEIAQSIGLINAEDLMSIAEDQENLDLMKTKYEEMANAAKLTEEAQLAISSGDYSNLDNLIYVMQGLETFDPTNLEGIDDTIISLGDQVKKLETAKTDYLKAVEDGILNMDPKYIQDLNAKIEAAEAELQAAQAERERLYGEINALAYSDAYTTNMDSQLAVNMPVTGEQGANAMITAADTKIKAWQLPPKYIDIYARYHDIPSEGSAGSSATQSSGSTNNAPTSRLAPQARIMPMAMSLLSIESLQSQTEEVSPFASMMKNATDSIVNYVSSGGSSPRVAYANGSVSGTKNIEIEQVNNFNVAVEKPSETARKVEQANKNLAKKI